MGSIPPIIRYNDRGKLSIQHYSVDSKHITPRTRNKDRRRRCRRRSIIYASLVRRG
jgi:hypothetical protein